MVRLVLKGSNRTFDSLHTDYKANNHAFTILANTFKSRTGQEWDKKYLLSFGLVDGNENLTNAGALFADDCPLPQSRLYCTHWEGKAKGDAINDAEFTGNVLMLLREAMNFVKSMAQLDYMEKRGSGLTRICNETKALDGYKDELKPIFKSTPSQFQTIIFAAIGMQNDGDVSETKLTERQRRILDLIKASPTISGRRMSEILPVSQRTIERDISALQKNEILRRKGKDNDGEWIVIG